MAEERWELHPLEVYRNRQSWTQKENAIHFRISYGHYRRLVNGWSRPSWDVAEDWARRSRGAFSSDKVMRWHRSHDRTAAA